MNKTRIVVSTVFILIAFTGCKKFIQQGQYPSQTDPAILFEKSSFVFQPENIELRYLVVKDQIRDDHPDDLAIYLHGMNRTEMEWVEKDGFGTAFYQTIQEHPKLPSLTVASVSIGGLYMMIEDAPPPFKADLETLFIKKVIPLLREKLNKKGNLYLIGHSLGGFNILSLTLRNPGLTQVCAVISPYTAPISPYQDAFDAKGDELNMPKSQTRMLKKLLTDAFTSEDKWYQYNPFRLAEKADPQSAPFYFFSAAENDLPGFEWAIDLFAVKLKEKGFQFYYCKTERAHWSVCRELYPAFLEEVQKTQQHTSY